MHAIKKKADKNQIPEWLIFFIGGEGNFELCQ
jgi:hypothetical protein